MLDGGVAGELGRRVADAVRAAFAVDITADQALIRPSGAGRGADYQSNVALGLASKLRLPPGEVAARVLEHFDPGDVVEPPWTGGAGFLNFVLRRDWLEQRAMALAADDRMGVPLTDTPHRVVVDYSGPNVAKEMHVGHLRSTIIGDAIVRLLDFEGHEVIRRNHLGDWGTPFGMLLEHLVDEGLAQQGEYAIGDLNSFYQEARKKFDADPSFAERSRNRVVALQSGDAESLVLWRKLVDESKCHFAKVYQMLGVLLTDEDTYGESFYAPFLDDVVAELEEKGLARLSEGALCVFPPGFTGRDGEPLPLIIRKSDGGYNYGATDLAGVRYWATERKASDLVYVVGAPQRLHLQMVFKASEQAGWLDDDHRAVHVPFGSILGAEGKVVRTRAGGSVKLVELLEEAVDRAADVIADRGELDAGQRRSLAQAVGIGAVKYADLSSDRERDYAFDWDRMLAMEGNTSVYLQYANARVRSVIRKAGGEAPAGSVLILGHPAERALALQLAQFLSAVDAASTHLQPHRLCTYLYETAQAFSTFYENCPILAADNQDLRNSRLTLCQLTSRVMVLGLQLLGIDAPERL